MKTNILSVNFDNISHSQALDKLLAFLDSDRANIIFTPNPEMVMLAQKNKKFNSILNSADLLLPDGVGIVYASRLTKSKIPRRVTGIDLLTSLFPHITNSGHSLYFLGAAPGVAETAAARIKEQFKGLSIAGVHHGYFKDEDDDRIIADINASDADIVLVGMNFPRQEEWIFRHKDKINAKILMVVGGSFDVFSGKIPRAPKLFQKLGLEWLFRLLRQPSRIWRQRVLVKFAFKIIYKKLRGEL